MTTFKQIEDAAYSLNQEHGSVGFYVNEMLASAWVNASDTVYEEKSAPVSELDAIALSSLSDILANSANTTARTWFASQGVRF